MHEEISKIAVCGPGGVGKTIILMHIYNELLTAKKFYKVIWVTMSKDFDVVKLQNDIACALSANVPKEWDKVRRAGQLSNLLKEAKRYVLILDDVWEKISLNEVGIPEPTTSNGCILAKTSRKMEVCKSMGFKVIKVEPLTEEEALTLLSNKVGPAILHIPTLESTLKLVAKECAGLPLTIVVVAGSLREEDDLCVLYPEDFQIPKEELIEYWIDEGMFDEMETKEAMKNKGHAVLKRLEDNCLLENAGIDRDCVKMHDAVRDMALSITSTNPRYMVKAGMQLEQLPEEEKWAMDAVKISLMENSIRELLLPVKCERLTTLLLGRNPVIRISESFFINMPCLRVLDLSHTRIECLPNSTSDLENLTALLLQECYYLRYLPSLAKLRRLKKLDLCSTMLKETPQGLEMLVNLKYHDLYRSFEYVFSPMLRPVNLPIGLLPKLSRLQYLRLHVGGEVKAEEVVQLEKLEHFEGHFKDLSEFRKYVQLSPPARTLSSYRISVNVFDINSS
ncbi:hypothetical protein DITRI_Ditri01bG0156100 [Diplodiscus trichospermus]